MMNDKCTFLLPQVLSTISALTFGTTNDIVEVHLLLIRRKITYHCVIVVVVVVVVVAAIGEVIVEVGATYGSPGHHAIDPSLLHGCMVHLLTISSPLGVHPVRIF